MTGRLPGMAHSTYPAVMVRRCAAVLLVAVGVFCVSASAVEACTCLASPNNCQLAATADAVFEATVESVELAPRGPTPDQASIANRRLSASEHLFLGELRRINLRDSRAWRGASQETVLTAASADACGYDFRAGTRYLIVATRLEDGRLVVTSCGLTRPISEAAALLEYVQTLRQSDAHPRIWGKVRIVAAPQSGRGFDPGVGLRVTAVGPVQRSTVTDADGRFVFSSLPYGDCELDIRVPDSRPPLLLSALPDGPVRLQRGRIPACEEVDYWGHAGTLN
jgi:hypothetical protein